MQTPGRWRLTITYRYYHYFVAELLFSQNCKKSLEFEDLQYKNVNKQKN